MAILFICFFYGIRKATANSRATLHRPHANESSSTILCPLHDRIYDLRAGAGLNADCRLATYPPTVDHDGTIRLAAPAAELVQV